MSLIRYFSAETLSEFLRRSNYWAKLNRNQYPIKINRAISELYEWIDCPCGNDCECRKYGCEKHLVRKTGVDFESCYHHFLECYVDSKAQNAVIQGRIAGRAKHAVEATNEIRERWAEISATSIKTHLLCSNWFEPPYGNIARDFQPNSGTLYRAKWMSLLCFDNFTAYDTGSVGLLKRDFKNPSDFLILMKRIRLDIIAHLQHTGRTLQEFRKYDNPSEFFKEIPRNGPKPIGNIIDKLYLTL